jgi:hypothetical protein
MARARPARNDGRGDISGKDYLANEKLNMSHSHDLAVLYIASRSPEWVHAYELKKAPVIKEGKLGSESDRRMQEVFQSAQGGIAQWDVKGRTYEIQRGGEANDRTYRLVSEEAKKRDIRGYVRDPLTGELFPVT